MTHLEAYQQQMQAMDIHKQSTMNCVVSAIKTIAKKPLHIGNMVYYYVQYNGRDVPAYCYACDYKENSTFYPIYDEENTGEFGWANFEECCRIFDVIEKTLEK